METNISSWGALDSSEVSTDTRQKETHPAGVGDGMGEGKKGVLRLPVLGSSSLYEKNRTTGTVEDALCHAAQNELAQASPTVRGHDHQVIALSHDGMDRVYHMS